MEKTPVVYLLGADEAGRGCAIGDLGVCVVGAAIHFSAADSNDLSKLIELLVDGTLHFEYIDSSVEHFFHQTNVVKDSKKITKEEDRYAIADELFYLSDHSSSLWISLREISSAVIDTEGNINNTVNRRWNECIAEMVENISQTDPTAKEERRIVVIIDGNSYRSIAGFNDDGLLQIHNVVKADARFSCVSAASILAKCIHDDSIDRILRVLEDADLLHKLEHEYQIRKNKGYLTKQHMDAIRQFGPTRFHRLSFEPCKSWMK